MHPGTVQGDRGIVSSHAETAVQPRCTGENDSHGLQTGMPQGTLPVHAAPRVKEDSRCPRDGGREGAARALSARRGTQVGYCSLSTQTEPWAICRFARAASRCTPAIHASQSSGPLPAEPGVTQCPCRRLAWPASFRTTPPPTPPLLNIWPLFCIKLSSKWTPGNLALGVVQPSLHHGLLGRCLQFPHH